MLEAQCTRPRGSVLRENSLDSRTSTAVRGLNVATAQRLLGGDAMLIEQGHAAFVAICEDCEEPSSPIDASREVAVLRLMRARWRLKSFGDRATRTWCPSCQTVP